jgi:hypothetical protein
VAAEVMERAALSHVQREYLPTAGIAGVGQLRAKSRLRHTKTRMLCCLQSGAPSIVPSPEPAKRIDPFHRVIRRRCSQGRNWL